MADISKIPLVEVPFADGDESKVTNIDFLKQGVTAEMTTPTKTGGTVFTRSHLNGIGYFATLGAFLDRIGYPYGIRREAGSEFGGYPKGAILISEDDNYVREYVSQIDNNTQPLPTEADDGTYEGNEYWKPTLPKTADFFPDYRFKTEKKETPSISGTGVYSWTVTETGWYQLELWFCDSQWIAYKVPNRNNQLGRALCVVKSGSMEIGRLDGRLSISTKTNRYTNITECPKSSVLVALSQGEEISFSYDLGSIPNCKARIVIARWGLNNQ